MLNSDEESSIEESSQDLDRDSNNHGSVSEGKSSQVRVGDPASERSTRVDAAKLPMSPQQAAAVIQG